MKRKLIVRLLKLSLVIARVVAIIDDDLACIADAIEIVEVIRANRDDRSRRHKLNRRASER